MVSIFDSADDELAAKNSGKMNEDREGLLKEWKALCPAQKKKKKKKKKKKDKKGEDSESEEGEQWKPEAEVTKDWWQGAARGGMEGPSSAQRGFIPGMM